VAKTTGGGRVQYDDVVKRLEAIVASLEGGELSLEESLERFAEGIALVKQGEGLLTDAEKRIEQLLTEDGQTAPIEVRELPAAPVTAATRPSAAAAAPAPKKPSPPAEDDDVPF
jgi:exodeoxyribonuclease VII small subunit